MPCTAQLLCTGDLDHSAIQPFTPKLEVRMVRELLAVVIIGKFSWREIPEAAARGGLRWVSLLLRRRSSA